MSFDKEGFLSEDTLTFRARHRAQYADLFSFVDDLNRFAHHIKFSFDIHHHDLQEVVCSCLFLRILNSFAATVRLAELGLCQDSEAIGRVVTEALFYLKSCAEDPNETIAYLKSDQFDRNKLMNVVKDKNSSLHSALGAGELKEFESLHEVIKKQVEEEKIKERKAVVAARKAKLDSIYDAAYRNLSQSVHSSPRAISRYVRTDENGDILEVYSAPEGDSIPLCLFAVSSALLISLMVMRDLFKVEMPGFESLSERFASLDKEFSSKLDK